MNSIEIAVSCELDCELTPAPNVELCRDAARKVLDASPFRQGFLSIAIVDNAQIHELNRNYLAHDYATDVLSFPLETDRQRLHLEGEVIVSHEMAISQAAVHHWSPACELALYVIHGTLHLVGYEDQSPELRREMQAAEDRFLLACGLPICPR